MSAQEIDPLGRADQDQKATGAKRNRDYLADDELDEGLIREAELVGKRYVSPDRPFLTYRLRRDWRYQMLTAVGRRRQLRLRPRAAARVAHLNCRLEPTCKNMFKGLEQ